jgi:hypothetical protein
MNCCFILCIITLAQCADVGCTLYEKGGKCISVCDNCGVLCEASPITDASSLSRYSGKNCAVIVGDLYISSLPREIYRAVLAAAIGSVQEIRGVLYVTNNPYLTAMTFFSRMTSLKGVQYFNNPSLVDARLPNLQRLDNPTIVKGCDRLCPAQYTRVGLAASSEPCTSVIFKYPFFLPGQFQLSDIEGPFLSIMRRVFDQVTNMEVCLFRLLSFFHIHRFSGTESSSLRKSSMETTGGILH